MLLSSVAREVFDHVPHRSFQLFQSLLRSFQVLFLDRLLVARVQGLRPLRFDLERWCRLSGSSLPCSVSRGACGTRARKVGHVDNGDDGTATIAIAAALAPRRARGDMVSMLRCSSFAELIVEFSAGTTTHSVGPHEQE